LLQALVLVESRGRPNATSPKGAKGLLQLMPATARYYGVDPGNPRENLEGGARHLAALLKRYDGNLNLTLAAWNAGDTALRTWRGVPPYKETRRFIAKVKVAKEVLEAE
jgi:soluble lytic murein transglycosylase-like protein